MQATNGSLGIPMTPGGERATRIASLLQWAALRLDGDVATAAQTALERWVDYIVSEQGAWETVRPTHSELFAGTTHWHSSAESCST